MVIGEGKKKKKKNHCILTGLAFILYPVKTQEEGQRKENNTMVYCNTRSSARNFLSLQQSLELAHLSLENARKTKDLELGLELCGDAEALLIQIDRAHHPMVLSPLAPGHTENKTLQEKIVAAYSNLGELQNSLGQSEKARASYRKASLQG